jgi:hypothetical protein
LVKELRSAAAAGAQQPPSARLVEQSRTTAHPGLGQHELDAGRGLVVAGDLGTTLRTCSYPVMVRNDGARP